jgi:predicted nucleic acid-binding protein
MMRIFVDTSAFYALLARDDRNHQKAKKKWVENLEAPLALVTSNYEFGGHHT